MRPDGSRRAAPFVVAGAVSVATVFLPPEPQHPGLLVATVAFAAGLALILLVMPWPRMHPVGQLGYVIAWEITVALLRHGQGGVGTGHGALAILPVLWLALHGRRSQLIAGTAVMMALFITPVFVFGAPEYPVGEWRRALLWAVSALAIALAVHGLVRDATERRAHLELVGEASREVAYSGSVEPLVEAARHVVGGVFAALAVAGAEHLDVPLSTGARIPDVLPLHPDVVRAVVREPRGLREITLSHSALHPVTRLLVQEVAATGRRHYLLVGLRASAVTEQSAQLLPIVAADIAAALDQQLLASRLAEQATTDPLTGALNRRAWQAAANRLCDAAERDGTPVSVGFIDFDRFKEFNDEHGHEAGDQLLTSYVAGASTVLRPLDLLGRWGGEEFLILFPFTSGTTAAAVVDRLRVFVPASQTFSCGVAERVPGERLERTIRRADEALYQAKAAGRNRTVLATAP